MCKLDTTKRLNCQKRRRRREAKDENFQRYVPTALKGDSRTPLCQTESKELFALVPKRQTEEQRTKNRILCDRKSTTSSTSRQQPERLQAVLVSLQIHSGDSSTERL